MIIQYFCVLISRRCAKAEVSIKIRQPVDYCLCTKYCVVFKLGLIISWQTFCCSFNVFGAGFLFANISCRVWRRRESILSPFLKRGKANVMQAISRLLISPTATCLYWKLFGVFFSFLSPPFSWNTCFWKQQSPLQPSSPQCSTSAFVRR